VNRCFGLEGVTGGGTNDEGPAIAMLPFSRGFRPTEDAVVRSRRCWNHQSPLRHGDAFACVLLAYARCTHGVAGVIRPKRSGLCNRTFFWLSAKLVPVM
jgi:hypothetical protein